MHLALSARVAVASLGCTLVVVAARAEEQRTDSVAYWSATLDGWTVEVNEIGTITRIHKGDQHVAFPGMGRNLVWVGTPEPNPKPWQWRGDTRLIPCEKPTKTEKSERAVRFEYDLTTQLPIRVTYEISYAMAGGAPTLKRVATLTPTEPPLTQDISLAMYNAVAPFGHHRVGSPRQDGYFNEIELMPGDIESESRTLTYSWFLDGEAAPQSDPEFRLAIPVISIASMKSDLRVTHVADPFFSSTLRRGPSTGAGEFKCVFLGSKVPIDKPVSRTLWTSIQTGGPEEMMEAWYATALADMPPGPSWLHKVAWQNYDYLSHGGRGWYEDIDAAERIVAKEDRAKVVFTLHGWYDVLGRYCFDEKTGKLDDAWTAFPNAPAVKDRFPTSEPVKMTKAEMHKRIRYAKDRGFRVCLYFADGLTACEAAKVYAEDQLLSWGGWNGPDTIGKVYAQNPAHPKVYARYVNYLKALLAEYGSEIDALDWDETFMIRAGMVAPKNAPAPAYLGQAYMRLVRELTQTTTAFRKDLAFLASDCLGVTWNGKERWLDVPPFAIMAHGCYQDSHCEPGTWQYGIFPNFRNVLWSCNWQAVKHFDYTVYGVEQFDTPVATSNGWLDDKGIAHLTEQQRRDVVELFNRRKAREQRLHWPTARIPEFKPATAPAQ